MTTVLAVNAGSSSLKLRVVRADDTVAASLDLDHWDGSADHRELRSFLGRLAPLDAVGHRVVHGGSRFTTPVVLDQAVLNDIIELSDLAPLHQPRAVAGIRAVGDALPGVPAVACFDTAFHAGLPAAAARYALPGSWTARFGLRRYGFHGLSHAYAARRAAELAGIGESPQLRVVNCHLGAGSSLAAVQDGRSVDTTMGFTPLEGLVMATRPGDVDPGLLVWLQQAGLTLDEVADGLEHHSGLSGLAGLPGGSGDLRDLRPAADSGDAAARLAIDVHTHRLRKHIAGMAAAMDGLDILAFTGGIGEHQPVVRAEAANGLAFLGVAIDAAANESATADADISAAHAPVRTVVVTAREDAEIARQVRSVLA